MSGLLSQNHLWYNTYFPYWMEISLLFWYDPIFPHIVLPLGWGIAISLLLAVNTCHPLSYTRAWRIWISGLTSYTIMEWCSCVMSFGIHAVIFSTWSKFSVTLLLHSLNYCEGRGLVWKEKLGAEYLSEKNTQLITSLSSCLRHPGKSVHHIFLKQLLQLLKSTSFR